MFRYGHLLQLLPLALAVGINPSPVLGVDQSLQQFLSQHCSSCHDDDTQKGGINLNRLNSNWEDPDNTRIWTRVHDRVAKGEMPPKSDPQPDRESAKAFCDHLSSVLMDAGGTQKRSVLRRLNRVEYENTVCDLFGIRVSVKDILPEDPTAYGFDTVGSALSLSAEQMELYLQTADKVVEQVFGPEAPPVKIDVTIPIARDSFASRGINRLLLHLDDDSLVGFQEQNCPLVFFSGQAKADGTYHVEIDATTFQSKYPLVMAVYGGDVIRRVGPTHLVGYFDIPANDQWTKIEFDDYLEKTDTYRMVPYGLVAPTQGPNRFKGPGLRIGQVSINGPLEAWPPTSRKTLFGPADPTTRSIDDARKILTRLASRAFRRQVASAEIDAVVALTDSALQSGRSFAESLGLGIKMILCSPEFLLREEQLAHSDEETSGLITDEALASRLSYFFWSSMPDEELLSLGSQNRLHEPEILHRQVERLLTDPKSSRFIENFTGQWLGLRDILFTVPDAKLYPEYDEMLQYAMVDETHFYFREILEFDRSLVEFVDSDWSYLNERLAAHYGYEGISGLKLRHVHLPIGSARGGVITQASVLKVTANGTTTSPIVRGVWVLNNILGQPTPPPPPDVPLIEPDIRGAANIREQIQKHTSIESCAGCHKRIDPPGLALESFDPIGGLRSSYRSLNLGKRVNLAVRQRRVEYRLGQTVDPSGEMLDGTRFKDVIAFKKILARDKVQLATSLTEKLLTYSLGRGIGFPDRPDVQKIVNKIALKNYGFRTLIHEIVQSDIFRRK